MGWLGGDVTIVTVLWTGLVVLWRKEKRGLLIWWIYSVCVCVRARARVCVEVTL